MRIKSIRIINFRSFEDQTIEVDQHTCLVGANGAGKSTILCALNVFFRENQNASTDLTALQEEDFYLKNTNKPIEITVEFTDLSEEAQFDFSDYFRQDVLVFTAKAVFDRDTLTAPVKQYGQRLAMPAFTGYFKAMNDSASVADLKTIYITLRSDFQDLPAANTKDAMTKALREYEAARPEACKLIPSEDQFYGITKGINRLAKHVQWVYIPAVKDASEEQAEVKNSAFGRLLARAVRGKVNFADEIKKISATAQEQYQKLLEQNQAALDGISASLDRRLSEWAHPDAGLNIKWQHDPKKSVQVEEPLAGVLAREGLFEGQLARFGHGLQRSFLISLLQELAEIDGGGPTLILGCEEPELYQHPPQASHLSNVLRTLSKKGTQILTTTHSPHFISGDAFENIRLIRRVPETAQSVVKRYRYDSYADAFAAVKGQKPMRPAGAMAKVSQVLQPALNELFFAQRLILVEGLEDAAYIHSWLNLTDRWDRFRARGVHVVPVHAKHAILQPLLIAKGFDIPVLVIYDSDTGTDQADQHERDNVALLKALGGDATQPFPEESVWAAGYVAWSTNMGETVQREVANDAWTQAGNFASNECGMARDLVKNALHIGARLAWLWEKGHRPPSLERLCDAVISFD
ncbi:ATP-dependent nuclease [Burkholderia ubonensis]|uniref:ATP-dependent nuclease n=1 Tax=Burkholderia ubonensis TaxID=101571 RepID=UPI0009B35E71|nr:AAA family ATPase [Burkholderia ubonensis]